MKRLPVLMHIKVEKEEGGFGLWLPLFLIVPLVLAILVVLSPLILAAVMIFRPEGTVKRVLFVFRAALVVFFSMHGLNVDIDKQDRCVRIAVI